LPGVACVRSLGRAAAPADLRAAGAAPRGLALDPPLRRLPNFPLLAVN